MSLFIDYPEWVHPHKWPDLRGNTIALDLETKDPMLKVLGPGWALPGDSGFICGVAVSAETAPGEDFTAYYPMRHTFGNVDPGQTEKWLQAMLADPDTEIVCHNAPYDVGWLKRFGYDIRCRVHDTQVAAVIVDENRWSYSLDALAKTYLKDQVKSADQLIALSESMGIKDPYSRMDEIPPMIVGPYAEDDVRCTLGLWKQFRYTIEREGLQGIYDLEMELQPVLHDMRRRGVRVDVPGTEEEVEKLRAEEEEIAAEIKRECGRHVEIWASESIVHAMDACGIEFPKNKEGNPEFQASWLEKHEARLPQLIVQQRRLYKLRSTFLENYILGFQQQGRVYPQFDPLRGETSAGGKTIGAVTGRFSATRPAMQTISNRDPVLAARVRPKFLPEEGDDWLSVDYASQEPRLYVHFSILLKLAGAEDLQRAYLENPRTDLHQIAADLVGLPRKQTKSINLGIAYGMGGAKLARELGLPTAMIENSRGQVYEGAGPEAQEILNRYDARFPFLRELAKHASARAEDKGEIRTILGRKRRFLTRFEKPKQGERKAFTYKALNCLIQGSAADQTKKAMIDAHRAGLKILLTIHDELCFSVSSDAEAKQAVEIMEQAVPLKIPVVADPKIGPRWGLVREG